MQILKVLSVKTTYYQHAPLLVTFLVQDDLGVVDTIRLHTDGNQLADYVKLGIIPMEELKDEIK